MISFTTALLLLIGGYFTYGLFVEKVFGADKNRKTPAITNADGVDFVPMSWWKIFFNPIPEHCGTWSHIRCDIRGHVRSECLFVDSDRLNLCGGCS